MTAASQLHSAGDLGTFRGGSGFPVRYQGGKSGELPFFKVSDMNSDGNELFMTRANNYITESQRKSLGAVRFPARAIVFAKVGAAVFKERKRILAQDSCIDNNMAAFIVDERRLDVRFAHYLLTAFKMSDLVAVGALPSLNGGQLRSIPMLVPPELSVQRRIAAALTDADDLIDTLNALIVKKQAIKQGMMQQLLTGRTRLPGFTALWGEPASFEELCTRSTGFWGESHSSAKAPNRVQVITAGDITPEGHLKGAATRFFSNAQVAKARCIRDDLVVTSSGNGLGKTAYIDEPGSLAASNFVRILRPRRGVSGSFLAQVMRIPAARAMLDSNTATSAYPNLLPGFFTEPWIPRPPLDEQLAVAAVLRDADLEVTALRERVAKARAIKTGMMQQLLTGRVRLPVEATS